MAKEKLTDTLVFPNFEQIIRYTQYDCTRITVSKTEFDVKLRELARSFGAIYYPGKQLLKQDIENLFQSNPVDSINKRYDIVLTNAQYQKLLDYLEKGNYYYEDQGNINDPDFVLAFSFGEKPGVNSQICYRIEQTFGLKSNPPRFYAQWEIADMLPFITSANLQFHRIGLDPGKDYMNTKEVIQKFISMSNCTSDSKVFIVSQAWHGPRCWNLCKREFKLNIVGGLFVDLFSSNDPQSWVRDELSWVIKES